MTKERATAREDATLERGAAERPGAPRRSERRLYNKTIIALLMLVSLPAAAQNKAQPRCSDEQPQGDQKTKYEVVIGPDGKKVFRIKTGFVICGKVPKPEILYGLLSSTINYEWETLKQNFLPKVFRSVEDSPF